jgi:hypothetical protein
MAVEGKRYFFNFKINFNKINELACIFAKTLNFDRAFY